MEQKQLEDIRYLFNRMQTTDQFLDLLNALKTMYLKTSEYPFKMCQLNYYSNPRARRNCYHEFSIPKKNGTNRIITAPTNQLKMLQTILNVLLNVVVIPHEKAYGFVSGKSIVENARIHIKKNYVYNIDLKDFFHSVDQARVWTCLRLKPLNLVGDRTNERDRIANMIAAICCKKILVERLDLASGKVVPVHKNVLPQGAPTSPILTNLVCQKLDFLLNRLAKNYNVKYSRYADDITFSSNKDLFQAEGDFLIRVNKIIVDQGFRINESKVRLQSAGYRQEVTGLTVNEGVNVSKIYIKEIRKWLYLWERYGYVRAFEYYCESMQKKEKDAKILEQVLRGKLNFLSMVKGKGNATYQSLMNRFVLLVQGRKAIETSQSLKNSWEDTAMSNLVHDILAGNLSSAMHKYHG
jgi:RNA-directed DNA polymerase